MTKKEQLYQLVRAHQFISQHELAEQLRLSRSAVAGHIASLTREHRILGRAYILPDVRPLVCIGGANIDRQLRTLGTVQMGTSNPVSQSESFGGVARNMAENLARLGVAVRLLCAVGADVAGDSVLAHAASVGVEVNASLRIADGMTGSYTALLDQRGELVLAMAHMTLSDALTPAYLESRLPQRRDAVMTIADLNLPKESLQLLLSEATSSEAKQAGAGLVFVAVSAPKMAHLPTDLHGLRLLILNQDELEAIAGQSLNEHAQLFSACQALQQRGVQDVIVTLGQQGVLLTSDRHGVAGFQHIPAAIVPVVDVTGAGDAFAAGVCWFLSQQHDDLESACRAGLRLAALTLQSDTTVSAALTRTTLMEQD